jgi:hypothetical protein
MTPGSYIPTLNAVASAVLLLMRIAAAAPFNAGGSLASMAEPSVASPMFSHTRNASAPATPTKGATPGCSAHKLTHLESKL